MIIFVIFRKRPRLIARDWKSQKASINPAGFCFHDLVTAIFNSSRVIFESFSLEWLDEIHALLTGPRSKTILYVLYKLIHFHFEDVRRK